MKKVLCLLMTIMMLCGTAVAEIDLSGMTLEEIKDVYTKSSSELFVAALINGVSLPFGEYVVGEDIPAGNYVITIDWPENADSESEYYLMQVKGKRGTLDVHDMIFYPRAALKISLEEGQIFNFETRIKAFFVMPKIQLLTSFIIGQ